MTDETTARDRAIVVGANALIYLDKEDGAGDRDCAAVVIDTLLAHPEVLRALTWHVDDLTIMGEYVCARIDRCTCGPLDGMHEQHCGYEPIADLAAVRGLLELHAPDVTADPGTPAATPTRSAAQTEFLLFSAIGHAEQPGVLPEGVVAPIQHLLRNVMYYRSELAGSWIAAAGELAEEILSIDPEGMDLMADELEQAQAANERVREFYRKSRRHRRRLVDVEDVRRALDGDTIEEER